MEFVKKLDEKNLSVTPSIHCLLYNEEMDYNVVKRKNMSTDNRWSRRLMFPPFNQFQPENYMFPIEEENITLRDLMAKMKPPYALNMCKEVMRRECGFGSVRGSGQSSFEARAYASRFMVESMKLSHILNNDTGHINRLNFHRSGTLLCSGCDKNSIVVWNLAQKKPTFEFSLEHKNQILDTKFLNDADILGIFSSHRDGKVILSVIHSSGGVPEMTLVGNHDGHAFDIATDPRDPFEVISVGSDGHILQRDIRDSVLAKSICKVLNPCYEHVVPLLSVAHHPLAPQICVSGETNHVYVYDKRNTTKALHQMCPSHMRKMFGMKVTSAIYNKTGTEILASFAHEDLYVFNNNDYRSGEYLHRYKGHCNNSKEKGLHFFGPNSDYVVYGSDCGSIFFWEKTTEAIVNLLPITNLRRVQCLDSHPMMPILASSDCGSVIKIWAPSSSVHPPNLSEVQWCLKRNLRYCTLGRKWLIPSYLSSVWGAS